MLVICIGGPSHGERHYVDNVASRLKTLYQIEPPLVTLHGAPVLTTPQTAEYEVDAASGLAYCTSTPKFEIEFVHGPANGLKRTVNVRAKTANCFSERSGPLVNKYVYKIDPLSRIATYYAYFIVCVAEAPSC